MRKNFLLLNVCILVVTSSCKDKMDTQVNKKEWSDLPAVIKLDSLQQTAFVPTLESPINPEKNTVYAAVLLYAWDTITKLLPGDITDNDSYSSAFNLLRKSTSFKKSLTNDEYSIKTEVQEDVIIAEAFFNKTLPFPVKMDKAEKPMQFGGSEVNAFGIYTMNTEVTAYTQILFYDSDDRFLVKLSPKEEKHEVWLMKAADTDTTLASVVQRAKEWKANGEKEAGDVKLAWKYAFNPEDVLSIPEIKFNIETHYKELEGQVFFIKDDDRMIATAYQRTGFILNETGAVAESHAIMAAVDSAAAIPITRPKPKNLVFDKPFYVILKRTDSGNPYFVMQVANAELLVQQ